MKRRGGSGGQPRSPASTRVAEDIRMKLAQILHREVGDPRLAGVHLTRVELGRDLVRARVFWRTLPGAATEEQAREGFKQAQGHLRRLVASALRLRNVPELVFELDESLEQDGRMGSLLAGLRPAGEPRAAPSEDDE